MQIVKNSIAMRLFRLLYIYYNNSYVKRIVLWIVNVYRYSILVRVFESVARRRSAMESSVFIKVIRILFNYVDRFVMRVSKVISDASGKSVIESVVKAFKDTISCGKATALILPLFGMGYALGRIVQNRFMLRDILFLGITFIAGAVFMADSEKRKIALENSFIVKIYKLIME